MAVRKQWTVLFFFKDGPGARTIPCPHGYPPREYIIPVFEKVEGDVCVFKHRVFNLYHYSVPTDGHMDWVGWQSRVFKVVDRHASGGVQGYFTIPVYVEATNARA